MYSAGLLQFRQCISFGVVSLTVQADALPQHGVALADVGTVNRHKQNRLMCSGILSPSSRAGDRGRLGWVRTLYSRYCKLRGMVFTLRGRVMRRAITLGLACSFIWCSTFPI